MQFVEASTKALKKKKNLNVKFATKKKKNGKPDYFILEEGKNVEGKREIKKMLKDNQGYSAKPKLLS